MQEYDIFSVLTFIFLTGLFLLAIARPIEIWLDRKVREYEKQKLREANNNENAKSFDEIA